MHANTMCLITVKTFYLIGGFKMKVQSHPASEPQNYPNISETILQIMPAHTNRHKTTPKSLFATILLNTAKIPLSGFQLIGVRESKVNSNQRSR